jgi:uncharacterized protein YkwD
VALFAPATRDHSIRDLQFEWIVRQNTRSPFQLNKSSPAIRRCQQKRIITLRFCVKYQLIFCKSQDRAIVLATLRQIWLFPESAQSVVCWLASHGTLASRQAAKGLEPSNPVADNGTDDGRAKNRRVELVKQWNHGKGSSANPVIRIDLLAGVLNNKRANMRITFESSILLVAFLFCLPRPIIAQNKETTPDQILFQSANRDRAAQGLPPLKWDDALATAAHAHSVLMSQQNTLSHQFPGEQDVSSRSKQAGARFSSIGENVAQGSSAAGIHDQWMKSPPHRRNLLDPDFNAVGIAMVDRGGILFATEDFSHSLPDTSLEDQEQQLGAALKSRGFQMLDYTADARRSCAMDRGYAGKHVPSFVIRYTTTDLSALPDILLGKIKSGLYHHAAVGACPAGASDSFAQFRVAVLLFE